VCSVFGFRECPVLHTCPALLSYGVVGHLFLLTHASPPRGHGPSCPSHPWVTLGQIGTVQDIPPHPMDGWDHVLVVGWWGTYPRPSSVVTKGLRDGMTAWWDVMRCLWQSHAIPMGLGNDSWDHVLWVEWNGKSHCKKFYALPMVVVSFPNYTTGCRLKKSCSYRNCDHMWLTWNHAFFCYFGATVFAVDNIALASFV